MTKRKDPADFLPRGPRPRPVSERFWEKVIHGPRCWGWDGTLNDRGYGVLAVGSATNGTDKPRKAHVVSWELHNGPVPEGMWVLHHCDNPPCTNPDCLYLGTVLENNRDTVRRKRRAAQRRTECLHGHPFTPANTYIHPVNGWRKCRACDNARHSRGTRG